MSMLAFLRIIRTLKAFLRIIRTLIAFLRIIQTLIAFLQVIRICTAFESFAFLVLCVYEICEQTVLVYVLWNLFTF